MMRTVMMMKKMIFSSYRSQEQSLILLLLSLQGSYLYSILKLDLMKKFNVCLESYDINIVYFRMFDVNGDKRVDETDMQQIMKLLFGRRMSEEDCKNL